MDAIGQRWSAFRDSGVIGQLLRFGIVGGLSALIYSAVYLPLAAYALPQRLAWMAVPPAFGVAVVFGFFLHRGWSFRGHGSGEGQHRHLRFFAVQSMGMLLNAGYALVLSDWLRQPAWVPLIPAVLVTPLATFAINRKWVFG